MPHRRLSLQELSQTPEFAQLSKKQSDWLTHYLTGFMEGRGFDPKEATRAVYACKTPENVRTMGAHLVSNPKIVSCVRKFFGETLEDTYIRMLLQAVRDRHLTVAQSQAFRLLSRELNRNKPKSRASEAETSPEPAPVSKSSDPRLPAGARAIRDKQTGALKGYLSAAGEFVQLATVEVAER